MTNQDSAHGAIAPVVVEEFEPGRWCVWIGRKAELLVDGTLDDVEAALEALKNWNPESPKDESNK